MFLLFLILCESLSCFSLHVLDILLLMFWWFAVFYDIFVIIFLQLRRGDTGSNKYLDYIKTDGYHKTRKEPTEPTR